MQVSRCRNPDQLELEVANLYQPLDWFFARNSIPVPQASLSPNAIETIGDQISRLGLWWTAVMAACIFGGALYWNWLMAEL